MERRKAQETIYKNTSEQENSASQVAKNVSDYRSNAWKEEGQLVLIWITTENGITIQAWAETGSTWETAPSEIKSKYTKRIRWNGEKHRRLNSLVKGYIQAKETNMNLIIIKSGKDMEEIHYWEQLTRMSEINYMVLKWTKTHEQKRKLTR